MGAVFPDLASERVRWLQQSPLFAEADRESLELFAGLMQSRAYGPGELLFRQGDSSSDVYLITRGDTEIRIEQEGRVVATDRAAAGSCVGEMAALTGMPRSATVNAGGEGAEVVIIPGPRFRDLLVLQPLVGVNVLVMMSDRLRQTELRKQSAALAKRADELGRSKEATDIASRSKSEFFASMSHEIRTPLNGILGLTELVLGTPLTPTQREYLGLVRESGESLLALINDILDLSKIEAGRLDLEFRPFALRNRLGETLKTLAIRAHRKGVELGCGVAPDVADSFVGDLTRIRQVLVNLVGNAIKFTERGEVIVEVRRVAATETESTLQFSVRDTGMGISKERLALLFQPYTQADASIARRFGGTGLGLSISKILVEKMRGTIWVDSTLGGGSSFHFTLPLEVAQETATPAHQARLASIAGKRVLQVQPNGSLARLMEGTLQEWRLDVTTVANGTEAALEASRATDVGRPFAFLVMDHRVPESLDWAQRIASSADLSALLLMTTDQIGEMARCDELRIPHLLKPVAPAELLETLTAAFGESPERPLAAGVTQVGTGAPAVADVARRTTTRILLVEDNVINQKLALALLRKRGHEVVLAIDGRAALAALDEQRFDLVLMDVLMPEMDGLEATAAIRARERQAGGRVPVIAMTANSLEQDVRRCLTAGMDAFLTKPVRPQQLFDTIDAALEMRPLARTSDDGGRRSDCIVDWPAALQQAGGQHQVLAERVALLLQEFPRIECDLVAATKRRDATELRRVAHTLKMVLGTFGAPRTAELALRLESLSQTQDFTGADELLAMFERESRRLMDALRLFAEGQG